MTHEANASSQKYIFGYGSLIIPSSLSSALGIDVDNSQLQVVELHGYTRLWRAGVPIYFEEPGRQATGVFLDIDPAEDKTINGIIYPVTDAQIERIKIRELQYDLIDVSDQIMLADKYAPKGMQVFTVISKTSFRVRNNDSNIYIPGKYVERINDACDSYYDKSFKERFWSMTEKSNFTEVNGAYTFIDEQQKKHV